MAGANLTTLQAVLKDDYKSLISQLNDNVFLLSQLERNSDVDAQGLRAVHGLRTSRNSGIGARSSSGALPTPGAQGFAKALVPLRYQYGSIRINGVSIATAKGGSASFVREIDDEMQGLKRDITVDQARQVYGTSDGVIAATGVTSASTTVVLAASTTATQMRQLFNDGGMVVDIGTVASPTAVAEERTVTSVDYANKTITISGAAVTTAGTDRIFRSGNGGASSNTGLPDDGQKELTGLQTIVKDSGVLHAVDPATVPSWKSVVDSNGGTLRAVSEALITKAIQDTQTVSSGDVNLLVTTAGVHRAIADDMRAMRRNVDTVALKAGYEGIAFSTPGEGNRGSAQRALVWDRDCPANTLFGLSTADLVIYEVGDWDWMDKDGAILDRYSDSNGRYDAYGAELFRYYELSALRRNSHFKIADLQES